jgi:hypothetical protein
MRRGSSGYHAWLIELPIASLGLYSWDEKL